MHRCKYCKATVGSLMCQHCKEKLGLIRQIQQMIRDAAKGGAE